MQTFMRLRVAAHRRDLISGPRWKPHDELGPFPLSRIFEKPDSGDSVTRPTLVDNWLRPWSPLHEKIYAGVGSNLATVRVEPGNEGWAQG